MPPNTAITCAQGIIELICSAASDDAEIYARLATDYVNHIYEVGFVDRAQYEELVVALEMALTRAQVPRPSAG
jgi:hypothetical protein